MADLPGEWEPVKHQEARVKATHFAHTPGADVRALLAAWSAA